MDIPNRAEYDEGRGEEHGEDQAERVGSRELQNVARERHAEDQAERVDHRGNQDADRKEHVEDVRDAVRGHGPAEREEGCWEARGPGFDTELGRSFGEHVRAPACR